MQAVQPLLHQTNANGAAASETSAKFVPLLAQTVGLDADRGGLAHLDSPIRATQNVSQARNGLDGHQGITVDHSVAPLSQDTDATDNAHSNAAESNGFASFYI